MRARRPAATNNLASLVVISAIASDGLISRELGDCCSVSFGCLRCFLAIDQDITGGK